MVCFPPDAPQIEGDADPGQRANAYISCINRIKLIVFFIFDFLPCGQSGDFVPPRHHQCG